MVRSVFHLTLRATEGFLRSLFHLLEWELPVPDYTTLCKRAKRLGVSWGRKAAGPLHLVLDSTGLKVFGEGRMEGASAWLYQTAHLEEASSKRGQ